MLLYERGSSPPLAGTSHMFSIWEQMPMSQQAQLGKLTENSTKFLSVLQTTAG